MPWHCSTIIKMKKPYRILMDLHQNPYFNKLPILAISIQKYFQRMGVKEDPK